ncbi:MAG TPA: thermonuclease family protein [Burkholderiales bacterium]
MLARRAQPLTPRFHLFRFAAAVLAAALALHASAYGEEAHVVRVLDGDSLRLADGREVRLIGINTPEFGKEGAPDQPLAAAARDRTRALVENRAVRLGFDRERFDRYGRTLAYVTLGDGRDLQRVLLEEGLAWFVAIPPNVARLDEYRAAEAAARRQRRGIWRLSVYEPVPAERLAPDHPGGFVRLAGTVRAVRFRRGFVLLALGNGVHLTLPRAADSGFPAPAALAGRRVLARGWLTRHRSGLRLRLTHPAMLELLP